MTSWRPATPRQVEVLLEKALGELHSEHRARFERLRIPLRTVAVSAPPGGRVVVVAEHEGKILYWSDIEEGWELEYPNEDGAIQIRGSGQFELSHLMYQLFGDPELTK